MKRFKKATLLAATAMLPATAGLLFLPVSPAAAAGTCTVGAPNAWNNGYVLDVTLGNTGPAELNGWTVTLTFTEPPAIVGGWNAALTTSGTVVTASNLSYNASIGVGQSVSFGFQGGHDGSFVAPTCTFSGGTTPATTTSTTRPTSSTTTTTTTTTVPATTTTTRPTSSTTTTTRPAAAADLTLNPGTTYQTVDGFGAAVSIWGGAWSTADTQTLVGMGDNQLGLSIVRTGISPVSGEWGTQAGALRTAKSYGSDVKILASPWTAPAAWKTNNSRVNGGSLKSDYYDDYAYHLNSYVQYMRNQGVTIDVTSVQNEPDWHPNYDSMAWTGDQLRTFVRDQGAKVQNTKLLVAESLGFNRSYTDPTLYDAGARNNIGYVGGHIYGQENNGSNFAPYPLAAQYGKNQWMTEWNFHEADGNGSNIWGDPTNLATWNETLDTVMRTVNKSMESNWSAYIWWYGRRYYSFIGDGESAYGTQGGAVLKRGWAFSQFSKYVRPGYRRIGLAKSSKASPLEVTAYQGDGKLTLVILNRSNNAVNDTVIQAPQNVTSALHTMTSRWSSRAAQPTSINGGQVTVSLPARSISTVVLNL